MRQLWDKFLMFNLAFLGLCFVWFMTLVLGTYLFKSDWGWQWFHQAWTPIVNPSLGIFFVGVVVSVIQSKLNRPSTH